MRRAQEENLSENVQSRQTAGNPLIKHAFTHPYVIRQQTCPYGYRDMQSSVAGDKRPGGVRQGGGRLETKEESKNQQTQRESRAVSSEKRNIK